EYRMYFWKRMDKKINRQMKRQALLAVLSAKRRDEEVIILDELKLTQPKTKEAAQILKALAEGAKKELQRGALLALPEKESSVLRAFKNLPKIELIGAKNLNILDLLSNKYLILLKNSIEAMEQTFIKSAKK
ncbi:MAG: 50S ribosomal protein L4, partial [Patescibacteria group bacterium]